MFILKLRRPGGARIYGVFDHQLPAALRKLPFDRHLSFQNVKNVVSEADGYQPHLIAPEQGYRRLIDTALNYFRGPAEASVDAVSSPSPFSCLQGHFLGLMNDYGQGHHFKVLYCLRCFLELKLMNCNFAKKWMLPKYHVLLI